jgi:hypothetical protein
VSAPTVLTLSLTINTGIGREREREREFMKHFDEGGSEINVN